MAPLLVFPFQVVPTYLLRVFVLHWPNTDNDDFALSYTSGAHQQRSSF
ncbi:hypothetical protein Slin15195_G106370 [Septoria linicola]|uniref:Uncharacterized protein n=1 Tax=Septoria linicola TaxID=215465 RepID=A0A9Q9EQ98_9PEZI|nr:hypothetical protein Slin15195_G106370 [Septoria linicola]